MIPTYRAHPSERKRLSRQCEAILARLQQSPATNSELVKLAMNLTARISELRQAGHNVEVVKRDHRSGLVTYALVRRGQIEMGF